MTGRVLQTACAIAMTLAALCFTGLTAMLMIIPPANPRMGLWIGTLVLGFLAVLSWVIAVNLWSREERRSVIPVWTIQAYGAFMVCTGVFMYFTHEAATVVWAGMAIAIGVAMMFAPRFLPQRFRHGHCRMCGYDLRGNPSAIQCPECGEATTRADPPVKIENHHG